MLGLFRRIKWAARLGILGLALNALVPIHFAFDLAEEFAAAQPLTAPSLNHDAEWRFLARLSGHLGEGGKSHEHGKAHRDVCPACASASTLAGFAPAPPPVVLPLPPPAATAAAVPLTECTEAAAPAGYRSRAPPAA